MNMVAIVRPRCCGSLGSAVHTDDAGDSRPDAKPYTTAPHVCSHRLRDAAIDVISWIESSFLNEVLTEEGPENFGPPRLVQ